MRRVLLVATLLGCGGARNSPERLGDEAWHRGQWEVAATQYRIVGDAPRLLAKRAEVALLSGDLLGAATLYQQLGEADPTRTGEAAAGLVRVAEVAQRAGNVNAVAACLAGLADVAPGWPLGRLAMRLPADAQWEPTLVAAIGPAGLAAGGGGERWLLALGRGYRAASRCPEAIAALEALRRRDRGPAADTAAAELASCQLTVGLEALGSGRPGEADYWLGQAATADPLGASGRRALVALGDARMAQGDVAGANLLWQQVVTAPVSPDSITVMALERLRDPGVFGSKSDSSVVPGRP
jgi:hypothetical protein